MWLGYGLLIVSVGLLIGQPLLVRYAIAALLFKFTDLRAAFILARVAGLDNSGRLMNSINLVIGGGMAAGPALAGPYCNTSPAPTRCWRRQASARCCH